MGLQLVLKPNTGEVVAKKTWTLVEYYSIFQLMETNKARSFLCSKILIRRGSEVLGEVGDCTGFHHNFGLDVSSPAIVSAFDFTTSTCCKIGFIPLKKWSQAYV